MLFAAPSKFCIALTTGIGTATIFVERVTSNVCAKRVLIPVFASAERKSQHDRHSAKS
jgi:hypothetical protein